MYESFIKAVNIGKIHFSPHRTICHIYLYQCKQIISAKTSPQKTHSQNPPQIFDHKSDENRKLNTFDSVWPWLMPVSPKDVNHVVYTSMLLNGGVNAKILRKLEEPICAKRKIRPSSLVMANSDLLQGVQHRTAFVVIYFNYFF